MRKFKTLSIATGLASVCLAAFGGPSSAAGQAKADFAVSITGPISVRTNEDAPFEIVVSNGGPDAANGKFQFGGGSGGGVYTGVDIVSAQPPPDGSCKITGLLVCQVGRVAPGASATVTAVVRPFAGFDGLFDVQAEIELDEATVDSTVGNNEAVASVPVVPAIKLGGLPRGCASKPFKLRVTSTVANAGKTKVLVDDKVLIASSKPKLKPKVNLAKLEGRKHEVEVIVQDPAGGPKLASESASFKTC